MTQTHSSERPAICPESFRRQRVTIASVCDDFTDSGAGSQRQYAQDHGIPRSTLGSWLRLDYADYPELEPQLVDFLLTAAGQRFLRRLIVATFTTFHFQAACGIRPVGDFLTRAGLHHFVGTSYGALHSLASQLRDDLAIFAAGERQRLAPLMPTKTIAVVGDENFHSQRPCLVALEPVSNFVLVEAYREHRDADTWTAALQEGLRDLPVQVVLLGSDRAKGLRKCANAGLEVPHSPDLFHDLRNFLAPLRPALNGPILQAQKELDEAKDELQRLDDKESRKPPEQQRSISAQEFATIAGLIRQENAASQRLAATTQRRDEVLRQVRGLGDDYHPFDRHSGRPVSAEELAGRLEKRVAGVEQWTEGLPLSEAAEAAPGKLRVWLTEWVAVVAWFWTLTLRRVEALELSEEGERLVKECLLPGYYWEAAATRARSVEERKRLRELAKGLQESAWVQRGALAALSEEERKEVKRVTREFVGWFARSSSCVEGRNGRLALFHHGQGKLSEKKLTALTVVHNYLVRRGDGTTAAERFFGTKPHDLFAWLLQRLPDLPRPAAKRPSKAAPTASSAG